MLLFRSPRFRFPFQCCCCSVLARRTACLLVGALILSVANSAALAQETPNANAAQIEALQKKLDALQSQMVEMQNELRQISGKPVVPHAEQSDIKATVEAEQQESRREG